MENLTSEGAMVYVALVKMSQNQIEVLCSNITNIEIMLKDDIFSNDRYLKEKIKKGLINLHELGLISIEARTELEDIKPNDPLLIRLLLFKIDTSKEHFVLMYSDELTTLMNCGEKKIEIEKLLRYFLNVLGTINNNSKVGFTTIEGLSEMSQIHIHTATTRYNQILEDLKLLYIHRHDQSKVNADGTVHKASNTYGRYSDKELVLKNVEQFYNSMNTLKLPVISSDEARGIKIKWNNMIKKIKKGYKPMESEISELDSKVELYNRRYISDKTITLTMISEIVMNNLEC